jgi:hypothetical protein
MHGVRARLLQEQADAVGLPVYQVRRVEELYTISVG